MIEIGKNLRSTLILLMLFVIVALLVQTGNGPAVIEGVKTMLGVSLVAAVFLLFICFG